LPGRKLWPATDNSVRPNGWCSLLVNFRLFCPPEKLVRLSGRLRPRLGRCTPLSPTPLANSDNPHPPLPTQAGRRIFVYRPSLCCHVSSLHPFLHAGLVQGFTSFVKTDSAGQVLSNLGGVSRADFRFDRHSRGALSICMALRADGFSARFIEADHRAPNDTRNERRFCCSFLGDLASRCSLASWTLVSCRSVATVV
jgi:hypothetical protein